MRRINVTTVDQYADLFWPQFVVVSDCVFLAREWENNSHLYDPQDLTQSESTINHTHILDLVRHNARINEDPFYNSEHPDFHAGCHLGRTLCAMWAAKLLIEFPNQDFRVYYHGFDPTVRFHKIRDGVRNWLEDEDWLDEIKQGACLIIDTRKIRKHNQYIHRTAYSRR